MWTYVYSDPYFQESFFIMMVDPLIKNNQRVIVVTSNAEQSMIDDKSEISQAEVLKLEDFIKSEDNYDNCVIVADTSITDLSVVKNDRIYYNAVTMITSKIKNFKCLLLMLDYREKKIKSNQRNVEDIIADFKRDDSSIAQKISDEIFAIIAIDGVIYSKLLKKKNKGSRSPYIQLGREIMIKGKYTFVNDANSLSLIIDGLEDE